MEGIYNIYKPLDKSSFYVIGQLRKLTGIKKIGHAGTLDPKAEGVLVVCIGRQFTRQISQFVDAGKEYLFTLVLGIETTTYDREGQITRQEPVVLENDQILDAILKLKGPSEQLPPMYSAVHYQGKRLYELARKGIEVERQSRPIFIRDITVEDIINSDYPEVTVRVSCSSGTYIRTLCYDIGLALGCGGYASRIVRTRVGDFHIKESIALENFLQEIAGAYHGQANANHQ